jgi:hypothetical protein
MKASNQILIASSKKLKIFIVFYLEAKISQKFARWMTVGRVELVMILSHIIVIVNDEEGSKMLQTQFISFMLTQIVNFLCFFLDSKDFLFHRIGHVPCFF